MPASALLLVLFAAICHTTWNLLLKRGSRRLETQVGALAWGVVLASPVLAVYSLRDVSPTGWVLIAASAVFETGYVFALTSAYAAGDLSLVYPVARGSAALPVVALAIPCWVAPVGWPGVTALVWRASSAATRARSGARHSPRGAGTRWHSPS